MSEHQSLPALQRVTPTRSPGRPILRRACACSASAARGGGSSSSSSNCPECARRKLQAKLVVGSAHDAEEHEADRVANAVMRGGDARGVGAVASIVQRSETESTATSAGAGAAAPPVVDQVLAGSGQALDPGARRFFEQRFGQSFGAVRVHADSLAAASARAVDANAYTVGNHVVFGASRYSPDTAAGRRLLAHELTHVVQQGATLRRASVSPPIEGEGTRDDEADEPVRRLRRAPAIVGLDESGPNADLTGKTEDQAFRLSERDKKLAECKKAAAPDPIVCDPATPPGWGQFTGTPAAGSRFGAETFSFIKSVEVPSQKCEESITGTAAGPTKRFQGVFTPGSSWVKPTFGNAADPATNGSAVQVGRCETFFDGLGAGQTGTWRLGAAGPGCAASAGPRRDTAAKKADCATVIAKDFNDTAVAESMRLLRHEQTHFALTCAIATKGNDLLTAGTGFAKIDAAIHTKLATAQTQFDTQSQHGCVAAQQAGWESKIAAGLPDLKLVT